MSHLPDPSSLVSYDAQVAGHASNVRASASGSVIVKPTLRREIDFYETLAHSLHPELLNTWTPKFYGTLRLEGKLDSPAVELSVVDPSLVAAGRIKEALPVKDVPQGQDVSLILAYSFSSQS